MEQVQKRPIWLLFFLIVLSSNVVLYQTQLRNIVLTEETKQVVIGSLIDLVIVLPACWMLYQRKLAIKTAIFLGAFGCLLARFLIPNTYLAPFEWFTIVGLSAEVFLLLFELSLVLICIKYLPNMLRDIKQQKLPLPFLIQKSAPPIAQKYTIVQVFLTEMLVGYYAIFSWRQQAQEGITLHKKSGYIAIQLMMIHGIVIETIGIHWWLHGQSMWLSLILLAFNIYSVLFLLADLQATRLNPIYHTKDMLYLSLGLMKKVEVPFHQIDQINMSIGEVSKKQKKEIFYLVANDFIQPEPDFYLILKEPVIATLFLGKKKQYTKIAIRSDDARQLQEIIEQRMSDVNQSR